MTAKRTGFFVVLAAACLMGTSPARADSIDGNWCHNDGRQITISGPSIVTPGGARLQGDYSRHAFSYVAPPGEPQTAQTISLQLLNENLMQSRVGTASGTPETWRRCQDRTSGLDRRSSLS